MKIVVSHRVTFHLCTQLHLCARCALSLALHTLHTGEKFGGGGGGEASGHKGCEPAMLHEAARAFCDGS